MIGRYEPAIADHHMHGRFSRMGADELRSKKHTSSSDGHAADTGEPACRIRACFTGRFD